MQIWAIILDTWRLLLARKLFWATLVVTALVGLVFLSIGFTEKGFVLFFALEVDNEFLRAGTPGASLAYFNTFYLMTEWWTTLFGLVLGLISCSSIFTEFMAPGAIDTMLSKPIGRAKLFFAKFASGLLFMAAQVSLLAVIAFVGIRWRLGFWHLPVFWSVPLVLASFSYLYAVAVFFSVWKRSAIIALVMTLLFWGLTAMAHSMASLAADLASLPAGSFTAGDTSGEEKRGGGWDFAAFVAAADRAGRAATAVLPKTAATNRLVQTMVMRPEDKATLREKEIDQQMKSLMQFSALMNKKSPTTDEVREQATESYDGTLARRKSPLFVVGTSLLFELVVLLLACRIFMRRDY